MCIQYLCFVCDRPLTGDQYFSMCCFNPQARPPWLEEWRPTPQCPRPIYYYSSVCHTPCNKMRVQTRLEIERQLGIEAVIGRSDGLWDWHRSRHDVQYTPHLTIPQVNVLLVAQWPENLQASNPERALETSIVPTQRRSRPARRTPAILPMSVVGPQIPVMSVAPGFPNPPKQLADRACDRCR